MNTTQTRPAPAAGLFRPLSSLARAILADWDDPGLSELALAARHGLTIEALHAQARAPAFRAALAVWRELRADRLLFLLARAEAHAARVLTALASREPDSNAAAKEVRLATKDLLRLLAPFPPASPAPGGAVEAPERHEGGGSNPQPPSPTLQGHPDPTPDPAPSDPQSGSVGAAAPTQQITIEIPPALIPDPSHPRAEVGDGRQDTPRSEMSDAPLPDTPNTSPSSTKPITPTFKPKSKRGYKSRPKPRSR
jgi:hypothetical protein